MEYDPGGASPDHDGGGSIHLVCDNCGYGDDYSPEDAEDGFYSCRQCSTVHVSTQVTAADPHDFHATGNISVRRVATQPTPTPRPRTPAPASTAPRDDFAEPSEPRDFAPARAARPEDLAARIRWCYIGGLQLILQRQLEVLVQRYQVPALVCGVAASVWLRWVNASKVFDELWVRQVLADHDAAAGRNIRAGPGENAPDEVMCAFLPRRKDRRRVEFAFLRSLRTRLPVYSTLAVSFLACHIAREAILPADIYKWAMEGKIPYIAAFTEVEKLLGMPMQECPLDARQLFRPVRVIGAWQLETAAGSIAQTIGLRLPSVNFYAIAVRCLKDLSLPLDKIIHHACQIYEWAMPPELWLSSNPARIPTWVSVMSVLIVALRILYTINGQGIWEEICEEGRDAGGPDPDGGNSEEFGIRELLRTLADSYNKINVGHDYLNDLQSYIKYCNEVIFTGITCSAEEEHLIEIFSDMYKSREDEHPQDQVKSQSQVVEEMAISNGGSKRFRDGTFIDAHSVCSSQGHDALQLIKSEMLDKGFHYMPPRKPRKSDGYLRYRRRKLLGGYIYVAHADYYMLLRAFAKLAEVDVRILHTSVLKLEKRLEFIEGRIKRSLKTLQNLSSETKDELRPVSG